MSLSFYKVEVELKVNNKSKKFIVVHNLPEIKGLSFNEALQSWLMRTDIPTPISLCKYINDKETGHVCMTLKQ